MVPECKNTREIFAEKENCSIFAFPNAEIAQLVERDLAKVEVAGSNPVFRSTKENLPRWQVLFCYS